MTGAAKLRYLRTVEGQLRGLDREMTQKEVVAAIRSELGREISQPYLSQLESGRRRHLTNTSRLLLSKFFRVHPGYLVDDPEGYQTELLTNFEQQEDELDLWLIKGAERFARDRRLAEALLAIAQHEDTRRCLFLLAEILKTPELMNRFWEAFVPGKADQSEGDNTAANALPAPNS